MQETYTQGVLRETGQLLLDLIVVVLTIYSLISISDHTGMAAAWAKSSNKISQDAVLQNYSSAELDIEPKLVQNNPVSQNTETPLTKIKRVAMETKTKPTLEPQVLGAATEAAVPAVTEAPVVYDGNSNAAALIDKYAAEYGVDSAMMKKIAQCESGMRAEAVNGPYAGIYQFLASTWSSNRAAMGEDTSPALRYNLEEAVKTAAFKMSRDGFGAWPACSRI